MAAKAASPDAPAASTIDASGPITFKAMIPGMAATNPTTPDNKESLAFASTSSSSLSTTVGTSALFVTWYAFESTRKRNASGNSSNESTSSIMKAQTTARSPLPTMTASRRPPECRSRIGPINGATTANGATVSSR